MKNANLLVISVLSLFLYGCNNQDGVFVGKNKYGLKFKQECIQPNENPILELFSGNSIQIIDTLLLVQHQEENPTFYWDVYSLNSMKHLKSILRKGRGPNEVLSAHYIGQYEKINDNIWMYFLDINSGKFLKININESIKSGDDIIELVSAVDADKSPYFILNNNSFIYCNNNRAEGYMSLMQGDNSWKNPSVEKKYIRNITSDDFNKLTHSIYYNKKDNKVCIVPFYVNHIQIIDLSGNNNIISSTSNNNNWQTLSKDGISGSTKIFYSTTRTTDDFIFALYNNKQLSEMGTAPKEREIHVFDWNGKAISKILLDGSITSFAVDINNKTLYGLDNLSHIYKYDISSCLDF